MHQGFSRHRHALRFGGALFAAWLPLAALAADFGDKTPSVVDFIDQLKGDDASVNDGVHTRGFNLRPGAASQATAVPPGASVPAEAPPANVPAAPAAAPSVSIQVKFDFGSDRVAGASRQAVENLATALQSDALRDRSFLIVGHTDAVGSAEYNQHLSERRAAAVKSFLVQQGVEPSRLKTAGRGFSQLLDPANPNSAANRRVEVIAQRG
ncbi:hypothetical protein GCM10023144_43870 [Pigmentiphaga soli]|uniref:OmpA-like domain-containing protein n=1 Tax=Pigmentiphaga soli TaxID=1007095 RepID=A0ABP8HP92_9BURK